MTNQTPARDRLGAHGVAERLVVPLKPGNAGGGKEPQFKTDARRSEGPGDWATYQLRLGEMSENDAQSVSAFPEIAVGSACTSTFSRLARRSLALRPAHSRRHLYVTSYTEGFSHFVTSMTAPVASGWSVRRVGLAPTGKRRLLTAHANSGRSRRLGGSVKSTRSRPWVGSGWLPSVPIAFDK